MSWEHAIARELKKRDNPVYYAWFSGEVCLTASVLCGLISTPITSLPMRVRLSAMARPRFPNPITKYFILYSLCYINIFSCG